MCQFLGIEDFGPEDKYVLNKDIDNDSATLAVLKEINQAIFKEHRTKPDTQQLNLYFFACHGIDNNSIQNIVLNEYDKKAEFYQLYPIEF